VKTSLGILRLEAGRRRVGWRGEGDEADRWAPHGSDVRERRHLCRNAPFGKCTKAAWAEWAERGSDGLRGKADQRVRGWAGWAEI
jgi:hypothetical protein